jgi:hypothetical protein
VLRWLQVQVPACPLKSAVPVTARRAFVQPGVNRFRLTRPCNGKRNAAAVHRTIDQHPKHHSPRADGAAGRIAGELLVSPAM